VAQGGAVAGNRVAENHSSRAVPVEKRKQQRGKRHRRTQVKKRKKKKHQVLRLYAGNLINLLSNTLCVFGNAKPQTM